MASEQAVTATHIREHMDTIPGLSLPASITDPMIEVWVQRKTAQVLELRGLSTLPSSDTQDRDRIDDAVLNLTLIEAQRHIGRGNGDLLAALLDEEKLIMSSIKAVKKTDARRKSFGFGVAGGTP